MSSGVARTPAGAGVVIGDTMALIQVPNQALFKVKAAARYLGITDETLTKHVDLGRIKAYNLEGIRVFKLTELNALIEALPEWETARGETPAKVRKESSS